MVVSVRLFAMLREAARHDRLEVELADGATVGELLAALGQRDGLRDLVSRLPVAIAVNREYTSRDHPLHDGDEVALIPPVSGGDNASEAVHARVTDQPLDLGAVAARAGRPDAGAMVTFSGTTRDVERLDYEAYSEMAEERIAGILADCIERHGLKAAAAEHRIGAVPLGETSVVVAVSAAHRAEAFAGARDAIDRIKAEAPIWKCEVEAGAEPRWVAGSRPPTAPA
ncbi:MAG TPA: molybdopterin converting factor subunit 1 [Solirubrobacteraceae bacterium]|nr:molybdopterin converting factor subunit 1 [Solirubrobacteraceae bacterium]